MSDVTQIVEEAKRQVQLGEAASRGDIERTASSFTEKATEANARLSRCAEYLRAGLLGEAIHLAEVRPNVLETVAVLDFEGQADWRQLVQNHGLPPLPPLSLELADALNKAYPEYQEIEEFVRKNRLFALARASVSRRLAGLREIVLRQPFSFWEDDLKEHEAARCAEIRRECAAALAERDAIALQGLMDELRSGRWTVPPPKATVAQVEQALRQVSQSDSKHRLKALVPQLNDALAAFDFERGRTLRDEWNRIIQESSLQPAFADQVREAFDWLAEDDAKATRDRAFAEAITELEKVLEDPHLTLNDLDRLWHDANRYDRELPRHLADRVRSRREVLRSRRVLQHRLVLAGVAGSIAALILVIATLVVSNGRSTDVRETAATVDQMLTRDQFEEADGLLNRTLEQHDWMTRDARVSAIVSKLADAKRKEDQRAAEFRQSLADGTAAPFETSISDAFIRADRLARTDAEKQKLANARDKRRIEQAEVETEFIQKFTSQVEQAAATIQELDSLPLRSANAGTARELINATDSSLRRLNLDLPRLSRTGRAQTTTMATLEQRLKTIRAGWEALRVRDGLDREITLAVGNIDQFCAKLQEAAAKQPDAARTPDLRAVLEERSFWTMHLDFESLVKTWRDSPLPETATQADNRTRECKQYLQLNAASPDVPALQEYLRVIEPIARRAGAGGAEAAVRKLFDDPFVKDMWILRLKSGETYYLKNDPSNEKGETFTASYVADLQLEQRRKFFKRDEVESVGRAPQTTWAKKAIELLGKRRPQDWDDTICQIAELLQSDTEIESVLQFALLRQLLKHGAAGSLSLELASRPYLDDLERTKIDTNVEWMDPQRSAIGRAAEARVDARRFLAAHPLKGLAADAREQRATLKHLLAPERTWVGWLHNVDDAWRCSLGVQPAAESSLWVVVPAASEPAQWVDIGKCVNGECVLADAIGPGVLMQGRAVFARRIDESSP